MKHIISACLAISLLSCSLTRNSGAELNNLNGYWVLVVFPAENKTIAELFTMKTPDLQIDVSNRTVSGTTGCNRISGSFTANRDDFKFGSLATTKMGCPGYDESIYLDAIGKVNRYRLNADQLSFFQGNTLLMTFVKKPNP